MGEPLPRLSPIHEDEGDENEETEVDSPLVRQTYETLLWDTEGFLTDMSPPKPFDYEDSGNLETREAGLQVDVIQPPG